MRVLCWCSSVCSVWSCLSSLWPSEGWSSSQAVSMCRLLDVLLHLRRLLHIGVIILISKYLMWSRFDFCLVLVNITFLIIEKFFGSNSKRSLWNINLHFWTWMFWVTIFINQNETSHISDIIIISIITQISHPSSWHSGWFGSHEL